MEELILANPAFLIAGVVLMLAGVPLLVTLPRAAAYGVGVVALAYEVLAFGALARPERFVLPALLIGLIAVVDTNTATLRTWFYRASQDAVMGAFVGAIIVGFVFAGSFGHGALGLLAGLFIGAMLGETRHNWFPRFNMGALLKVGAGTVMGVLGPVALKLLLGLVLIDNFAASAKFQLLVGNQQRQIERLGAPIDTR